MENQTTSLRSIWRWGRLVLPLAVLAVIALALMLRWGYPGAQQAVADATTEVEFSIAVGGCNTVGGGEANKCAFPVGSSFSLDMSWNGFTGGHAGNATNVQMVIAWSGAISGPNTANGKSLTNTVPAGCDIPVTVLDPGGNPNSAAVSCGLLFASNISTGVMGSATFNCVSAGAGVITLENSNTTTLATDPALQPHWEDNATDTLTINCVSPPPTPTPTPFLAPGVDDKMTSMGKFQIKVSEDFIGLMAGYPGYDGVSRLTSPRLFDPNTVVGRSVYHLDGDATDIGGASVGTANTIISDSDFSSVPAGFEGPPGSREVHTEIRELNLTFNSIAVRAGIDAPDQPISPGEVESQSATGNPANDFPAESFFNVFIELDLPAVATFPGGTLYNQEPLLIVNDHLKNPPGLPPKAVYKHDNSGAVRVFFKFNKIGFWQAGDLFGWLTLAGHGASFDDTPEDNDAFDKIFDNEIANDPLPIPDSDGGGAPDDLELAKGGDLGNPADDAALLALDNDQDGCTNGRELDPKTLVATGGGRDPLNHWDFMDMWVNKSKDRVVNIIDVGAIVQRFFTVGDPNGDPLDPPQDLTSYHVSADRSPPIGPNPWNAGPPDGTINIIEIGLTVAQFLHDCN